MKLVEIHDVSQIEQCRVNNHPEWGMPLSLEKYMAREDLLGNMPFAVKNQHTWALVDDNNEFFAHCETYHRQAYLHGTASKKESVVCASVASVYVPEGKRGHRYGQLLMKLLQERLVEMGVSVSALYSDVGPHFYHRHGLQWKPYSSLHLKIENGQSLTAFEPCLEMAENDLKAALSVLETHVSKKVGKNKTLVIPPDLDALDWLQARSKFYGEFYDIPSGLSHLGVKTTETIDDNTSWMVYFYDWRWKTLYVLLHHACTVEDAGKLLRSLSDHVEQAREFIDYAVIWNPSSHFIEAVGFSHTPVSGTVTDWNREGDVKVHCELPGVKLETRLKDSIPALAVYNTTDAEVDWIMNEKYAWV